MKIIKILLFGVLLSTFGCAQVPKESVELSATVGRDLAEIRKSHIALIDIYYGGLIANINRFIDDVYLPYQIQQTLSDDLIKSDMLSTIEAASRTDTSGQAQKDALQKLQDFHLIIHEDVENYRKLQLKPVQDQYQTVLTNVNQSYEQIHYANSIVTGHLASVVKVHDTQSELLEKLDLGNFNTNISKKIADRSDKISELIIKAKTSDEKLQKIISTFEELSD